MVSPRSLLAALPATTLLAFPAQASSPQTEGMMRITLEGRELLIDTNDIPDVWRVQDEETPSLKLWISQPDATHHYLVIGRHGTLEVTTLCPTNVTWLPHEAKRTGSVEWTETGRHTTTYRQTVRIIGKVVASR